MKTQETIDVDRFFAQAQDAQNDFRNMQIEDRNRIKRNAGCHAVQGTMNTERLDDLMRAVRIFRGTAETSREMAHGIFGQWDRQLREKWLKQASRRERAVKRLSMMVAKECDHIKQHYTTQV